MPTSRPSITLAVGLLVGLSAHGLFAQAAAPPRPANTHWSFQPVVRPTIPQPRRGDRVLNPIDAFLQTDLERHGLTAAPAAGRRELIRRLKYDLTGLPPTAAEVAAFVADSQPDAYERLVDRLLASPHYGEHWGRQWLDVVRYAETSGYNADPVRPLSWKYRDWVIDALNSDLPYDQFVAQQIAGDELFPENPAAQIATGYLLMWPDESNASNVLLARQDGLNDLTGNVATVFLGISLGCAQCHDHKFDPIPQVDFYRLQAFFTGIVRDESAPVASLEQLRDWHARHDLWLQSTLAPRTELQRLEAEARVKAAGDRRMKFPAIVLDAIDTPPELRNTLQRQLAFWCERQMGITDEGILSALSAPQKDRRKQLLAQLAEAERERPRPPVEIQGMVARELECEPPATHRLASGTYNKPLEQVAPGVPSFVATGSGDPLPFAAPHPHSSGRRTALARWLVDPRNPLVPRVLVNRLWQGHFGRGLIENANDLGSQSPPPAHPALLDWLAATFVSPAQPSDDSPPGLAFRLKALHRLLVTSQAYRQSGVDGVPPEQLSTALESDPGNVGYWHFPRRRLPAEAIRDSLLAIAGQLNPTLSGPSVWPELPRGFSTREAWKVSTAPADRHRRSVYIHAKRNLPYPLLEAFDLPDMHESCARRTQTTIAPQALMLLNSEIVLDLSRQLAGELLSANPDAEPTRLVGELYARVYARAPSADEWPAAHSFLDRQTQRLEARAQSGVPLLLPHPHPRFLDPARAAAFVDLCHALLNSNEFLFVD